MTRTAVLAVSLSSAVVAQQQGSDTFTWSAPAVRGGLVRVKNIRGDVSVEASIGNRVEVSALKVWRRGNPSQVRIEAQRAGDDVVVCVLWGEARTCEASVGGQQSRAVGDVSVQLVVKVPAGMRIAANTTNGDVAVKSDAREVAAESVNGNVVIRSGQGSVAALTVNGSVTAYLVEPVHATLDLQASGKVHSDFALQVSHAMRLGRLQATVGNGGRKIELRAMRGDISLKRAGTG